MASPQTGQPMVEPPSYEEVMGIGSYNQLQTNYYNEPPPAYAYDNFGASTHLPPVDAPSLSSGASATGSSAEPQIFVIRPPSPSRSPIPPKPSTPNFTPKPAANPTPRSNPTPASNPAPTQRQQQNQNRQQNQRQNNNVPRPSLDKKEHLYNFFHYLYLILLIQALCALAVAGGIYSNEYVRGRIQEISTFKDLSMFQLKDDIIVVLLKCQFSLKGSYSKNTIYDMHGLLIGILIFTWITAEPRKKSKIFSVIFLVLMTMIITLGIMTLASASGSIGPLVSVGIVAIHSVFLQFFIWQKKITFTLISGMLFTFIVVSAALGIALPSFGAHMEVFFGGLAALLFCWWTLLIIWCSVDDHKKHHLYADDYIYLQPFIYAGIIYMPFILLLIIFFKFEWKKYK
ncbi:uncharacterized protein LOC132558541 [Ylistrum balloti]|uniref:uncharacterized protein LOC132558541 n=1 Tax=Ylistrum balloti TaxID=509963 RepID=UPI002905ECC3|nr:uncharacterized protein LOC132558541 [Ylistrum balloti]